MSLRTVAEIVSVVALLASAGCVSKNVLFEQMRRIRQSEVSGKVEWMAIPGLSGAGLFCNERMTIAVDNVKGRIPAEYRCKAQKHQEATLKKGHAHVRAVLVPEIDNCIVSEGVCPEAKPCIVGYHVELIFLDTTECVR